MTGNNEKIKESKGLKALKLFFILLCLVFVIYGINRALNYNKQLKQSEARTYLSGIAMSQEIYHHEYKRYAKSFDELGLGTPKNQKYYTFYITENLFSAPKSGSVTPLPNKIKPFIENNKFLAVAVGNIDRDSAVDVWVVSEQDGFYNSKNIINDLKE